MTPQETAEREGYKETMTAPRPDLVQSPYSAACKCGLDKHWDAGQVRAWKELGLWTGEKDPPMLDPEV